MRLICPKCGAEYEPPGNMVPSGGRHVQCSACHTRWFAKGESQPMLTEDQIIARLESRTPNLRVVDEPLAAPVGSDRKTQEGKAETPQGEKTLFKEPEKAAAPVEKNEEPAARDVNKVQTTPRPTEAEESEDGFTWQAPEPEGDADTAEETPSEFAFEAPRREESEEAFTWEGLKETGIKTGEKGEDPIASVSSRVDVRSGSQTNVKPGSQDSPLRGAQKAQRPEVIHPRIIIHSEPQDRFWHGFATSAGVFAVLLLLFFAALGVADTDSPVGAAARTYAGLVNGLRELLAAVLPSI